MTSFLLILFLPLSAYCAVTIPSGDVPCDPASYIRKLTLSSRKVTLSEDGTKLFNPNGNGSYFRNFSMKKVKFGENAEYETTVYYPTKAASPETASVLMPLFHGMNAEISHGGSMLNMEQALVRSGKSINVGNDLDEAQKIFPRTEHVYSEAPDLPGCGNNTDVTPFDHYETTIDFYTQYLKQLRAKAPGKPLIAVGYCYSSGFLIEVARRNPELIDGLVLTALIAPGREMGLDFSIAVETKMYESGLLARNPGVQVRADQVYSELPWTNEPTITRKTPTLLMIGEKDPFQSESAKGWFSKLAKNNPEHLKYVVVPGAGHGVLGPVDNSPNSFITVLSEVNRFVAKVLKKSP
jgi:dienelactone hydrolase